MVYAPQEDSYLLAGAVEEYARGSVLDIGTGSGIQAVTAKRLEDVEEVLAVDIDPEAVRAAADQGIRARSSDRFTDVEGTFDTIICNAPYLPDEPEAPDVALDGGPKGYEWTLAFLDEAKDHLAHNGQILLLISSHTHPKIIEERLRRDAYAYERVREEKLFHETLIVYRITHALPKRPAAEYLAKGKRGVVYRDGDVAIKVAPPRRTEQEAQMLARANTLGLGPRLLEKEPGRVVMEYVEGPRLDRFLAEADATKAQEALRAIITQLRLLDHAGIRKGELNNPYKHVIITSQGPVQIDWERAKPSRRPQNLAQFRNYLRSIPKRFPHLAGKDWEALAEDDHAERVYQETCAVPAGKATTYGRLAERIGSSARAVGQALRKNPYAPTVPCHRVVAADGSLTGFAGSDAEESLARKERLLRAEGVRVTDGRVDPQDLL